MVSNTKNKLDVGLRPLRDEVLVRKDAVEEKTSGGILLTEQTKQKERPMTGIILAVGPGIREHGRLVPMILEVGQKALFHKHCGSTIDHNGEKLSLIRQVDIFGVME